MRVKLWQRCALRAASFNALILALGCAPSAPAGALRVGVLARPHRVHRGSRRPNTAIQPGRSGPAGGHYSTARDFLKLANALAGHRLLDSTHTAALYGARYAGGPDFRANGGGPGVNAEFSIYPSGEVMVVLSNYDPPAATEVAQLIRGLIGRRHFVSPRP